MILIDAMSKEISDQSSEKSTDILKTCTLISTLYGKQQSLRKQPFYKIVLLQFSARRQFPLLIVKSNLKSRFLPRNYSIL